MKPSFLNLFKRGKYFHEALPSDTRRPGQKVELPRRVKEAERYAVAALGFCLLYDKEFLRHFWNQICVRPSDPAPKDMRIEVEPFFWADLLLTNATPQGRFVYVVECKIGAPLAARQNPEKSAFFARSGYGRRFKAWLHDKDHARYILLRQEGSQPIIRQKCLRRIDCYPRSWYQLADRLQPDGMIADLVACLGTFCVKPFDHWGSNEMKICREITEVGKALLTLNDTVSELEFEETHCELDSSSNKKVRWWYGFNVLKLPSKRGKSSSHRALTTLVNPPDKWCGWFGYEDDGGDGFGLAVWFYCNNNRAARKLQQRLVKDFPRVTFERDKEYKSGEWWNVVVKTGSHKKASDRDWFVWVFRTAGIKPSAGN